MAFSTAAALIAASFSPSLSGAQSAGQIQIQCAPAKKEVLVKVKPQSEWDAEDERLGHVESRSLAIRVEYLDDKISQFRMASAFSGVYFRGRGERAMQYSRQLRDRTGSVFRSGLFVIIMYAYNSSLRADSVTEKLYSKPKRY
jgi:hypothetical protein